MNLLGNSKYKDRYMGVPANRSIRKRSDDTDATLQDCFASTDWKIFRDSFNGIEEYTTSVIGFINKCIDDVVPTVTVHTYQPEAMDYRQHLHRAKG